jgi:ABC-2 type transport system permease protein
MSPTIFKFEFRSRLKSAVIWSVSIVLLIVVFLSIFPGFADQAALLNELMSNFPQELRIAFGLDKMDLASVLGYFSLVFMFVQLCLAIQASTYGFGLVSIEETELTADFLLSKPVSRVQVLTSKLLAALAALTLTNLAVWAGSIASVFAFNGGRDVNMGTLALLLGSILIFQLFFLGVGLVFSLLVRRVRSVTPYALGLAFGAYVLGAFSGVFSDVYLEFITPFKHFDAAYIVKINAFNTPLVLFNIAVSLVALVVSYWLYLRRDIRAVS